MIEYCVLLWKTFIFVEKVEKYHKKNKSYSKDKSIFYKKIIYFYCFPQSLLLLLLNLNFNILYMMRRYL